MKVQISPGKHIFVEISLGKQLARKYQRLTNTSREQEQKASTAHSPQSYERVENTASKTFKDYITKRKALSSASYKEKEALYQFQQSKFVKEALKIIRQAYSNLNSGSTNEVRIRRILAQLVANSQTDDAISFTSILKGTKDLIPISNFRSSLSEKLTNLYTQHKKDSEITNLRQTHKKMVDAIGFTNFSQRGLVSEIRETPTDQSIQELATLAFGFNKSP